MKFTAAHFKSPSAPLILDNEWYSYPMMIIIMIIGGFVTCSVCMCVFYIDTLVLARATKKSPFFAPKKKMV